MKTRLRLTSFILALVITALALQLGCLAYLAIQLNQSQAKLKEAVRAQAITSCITNVSKHLYEAMFSYGADRAEKPMTPADEDEFRKVFRQDFDELLELTKDEPRMRAIIKKSDESALRCGDLMKQLRESYGLYGTSAEARAGRSPLWKELRARAREILSLDFLNLRKDQKLVADSNLQVQTEYRDKMMGAILFAGITTAITVLAAIYLTGLIAQKIARLVDNTMRLARHQQLAPAMKGNDELSRLDQVFHRMANELAAAAQKERALLDNARDLICSVDPSGKFAEVNRACEELLACSPEEAIGTYISEYLPGQEGERVLDYFELLRRGRPARPLETIVRKRDGEMRDVLCTAQYALEQNMIFCVFHDYTETKQAERLKQEVVAMVTHDLRSPLGTVKNIFDFLGQGQFGALNESGQKFMASGQRNVDQMMNLINDLLDIEKLKSGKVELELSTFAVEDLLQECLDLHSTAAKKAGVQLAAPSTDIEMEGDYEKLLRVVSNLTGNALKFTPQGGRVSLGCQREDSGILLSVRDSGQGIAKDKLDSVFERFQQLPGSAKQAGGSGLGLSICKLFTEVHQGRIWVESEEGRGSCFFVQLPLRQPKGSVSKKAAV